jgi:hypothetical protein
VVADPDLAAVVDAQPEVAGAIKSGIVAMFVACGSVNLR